MSKSVLLALTLPLGLLAGCTANAPEYVEIAYPVMALGQASMEFGEADWGGSVERTILLSNDGGMPMGIGSVIIGDAEEGSPFTVAWDAADVECDGVVVEDEETEETEGTAKGPTVDTAGGSDTGDTGESEAEDLKGALFLLEPGCRIPLTVTFTPAMQGDAYDALIIESVGTTLSEEEEDAGQDLPDFLADPVHTSQVIYLHGESEFVQGSLVVVPRSWDFGFVHPTAADDESPARIRIGNVGGGAITVTNVTKSDSCDEAYTLVPPTELPKALYGDESTLAEVTFTPTDTNSALCTITVETDDPANATVAVTIRGNAGEDPLNVPPTVHVRSPENGYRYSTIRPLTLELNIFDENQPATTLVCRVKSLLGEATVANCAAGDESGHVYVQIPAEDLEPGVDTLLVSVTDGSDRTAYASVSVVINSDYPADDDDGDGYGVASEPADCDDRNIFTYPNAAEVFDGEDNNCDGTADEGTEGYDDDMDGVAEMEGDCNDFSDEVWPGAPELADLLDNDCDGTVDETTIYSDDDGDGYTEVNGDCRDSDPSVNPAAVEQCDDYDNDCDGFIDSADGCQETDSEPVVVGNVIRMDQSACHELETVRMDVMVFDADRDAITYEWSLDAGGGALDTAYAQVVNYTAPEILDNTAGAGEYFNVYAVVFDEDGHQDWAFGRIMVWDAKTEIYEPYSQLVPKEAGSCSSTGGGPTGALVLAGAVLALAFRRRE